MELTLEYRTESNYDIDYARHNLYYITDEGETLYLRYGDDDDRSTLFSTQEIEEDKVQSVVEKCILLAKDNYPNPFSSIGEYWDSDMGQRHEEIAGNSWRYPVSVKEYTP